MDIDPETLEQIRQVYPGAQVQTLAIYMIGYGRLASWENSARLETLDSAIEMLREGLNSIRADGNELGKAITTDLAQALFVRSQETGSPENLKAALSLLEPLVQSTPRSDPACPHRLVRLSTSLGLRFERTGSMEDLDRAIKFTEEAINLSTTDHSDRGGFCLNFANMLAHRYERTDDLNALDQAIANYELAADSPARTIFFTATRLNNLAGTLFDRYERTGAAGDLVRAISTIKKALKMIQDRRDHPTRAMYLSTLGNFLQGRYSLTNILSTLDQAITTHLMSLVLTPINDPFPAMRLTNLGNSLYQYASRYRLLISRLRCFGKPWRYRKMMCLTQDQRC